MHLDPGLTITWDGGLCFYYLKTTYWHRSYKRLRFSMRQRRWFYSKESWTLEDDIEAFMFRRGYASALSFVNTLTEQITLPRPPTLKGEKSCVVIPKDTTDLQT